MVKYEMINIELDKEGIVFFSSPDRPFKVFLFILPVILLPAHPAVLRIVSSLGCKVFISDSESQDAIALQICL